MNGEQGRNTDMVPMNEMPHPNVEQYADYCAAVWEQVLEGKMDQEEAATLMFGSEPTVTFTRYAA